MDERPAPPPASAGDYGAFEEAAQAVDIVDEFTTPVEPSQDKTNGAHDPKSKTRQPLPRLKTAKEFVADFTPPDYLIDGVLQRGYFYTLTAKTGHGKTAVGLLAGVCTAAGIKLAEHECRQGTVAFFAGENADDVRARLIATLDHLGLDIDKVPIHFFDQILGIREHADYIAREVERIGGAAFVIIDSFAVFFAGEEENSNTEAGRYARDLRGLCSLPGNPTVLALAHPTKNPSRDSLVPRGGGAIIAEVDGNLRLWSEDFQTTELHWCGKLRGPDFEPESFRMQPYTCAALTNDNGSYPSVIAVPMTQGDIEQASKRIRSDEDALLDMMLNWPTGSIRTWCESLDWVTETGKPHKSKASRALAKLQRDHLVKKERDRWVLTKTGRKEAQDVIGKGSI